MSSPVIDQTPSPTGEFLSELSELVKNELVSNSIRGSTARVAYELGSLFQLSPDPLIAQHRMQGLWLHPAFLESLFEFEDTYLKGRWDLPVGEWTVVFTLVWLHREDADWTQAEHPDCYGWDVNHYYARFVIRALHGIQASPLELAHWLRDGELDLAIFILMHTLMYHQLDCMDEYKDKAPYVDLSEN
ncbi:hypothetical protein F5Y05DRAFT_385555 [Hypoxylon sp. FL0543]|nr:hypothetical protein F5Y05DRAFT_385555 [Hypoxylon sp. FL0543]